MAGSSRYSSKQIIRRVSKVFMIKSKYKMCLIYSNFNSIKSYVLNKFFCIIQRLFVCCRNTCAISDFRIWSKWPKAETTFSLLYPALLRTWTKIFSPHFSICKTYLTDVSLGVYQDRSMYLRVMSRPPFSQKRLHYWYWTRS